MTANTTSNAGASGRTSPPRQNRSEPIPADEARLSEAQYLQREADRARDAMSAVFAKATRELGNGVDPRAWTGEHPWIAMSVAAVAGFFTANMVVPSKEDQVLRKLAKLEKAVDAARHAESNSDGDDGASGKKRKRSPGMMGFITRELFRVIRPAIISAITATVTAQKTAEAADENTPDYPDETSAPEGPADPPL